MFKWSQSYRAARERHGENKHQLTKQQIAVYEIDIGTVPEVGNLVNLWVVL